MATHDELPSALIKSPSFQIERVRRHTKDEVERTLCRHEVSMRGFWVLTCVAENALLSLIHISEPTRRTERSRMPSSA